MKFSTWIEFLLLFYFEIKVNYCSVTLEPRVKFDNGSENSTIDESKSNQSPSTNIQWVPQIFERAKQNFQMTSTLPECNQDVQLYRQSLQTQTLWAIRMMESSQWPTGSIFSGELFYAGNYQECVRTVANIPNRGTIKGQYCLAEARYSLPPNVHVHTNNMTFDPNQLSTVWQAITQFKLYDPSRVDRTKVTFAQCVPSSCTPAELERALNSTLWPAFRQNGLQFNISVPEITCSSVDRLNLSPPSSYFAVQRILIAYIALLMACTMYDFLRPKRKKGTKTPTSKSLDKTVVLCFSIARNIRLLGRVEFSESIAVLRFLKVVMLIMVIYGHRFVYSIGYPLTNTDEAEIRYQTRFNIELVHANIVDMFFMVSAFLTFRFGLRLMKKAPALYAPLSIVVRWIRLVPLFAVVAVIVIYLMPYWGYGPIWNQRVGLEADNCARTLWANLLAINNLVDTEHMCLIVSWYVSVDLQLTVLGTVLLFFFALNEKIGFALSLLAFVGSVVTTFSVAYINKYNGLLKLYVNLLMNPRLVTEFTDFYIQPYARMGPYLVGFFAAYALKKLKERNYTITKKQICIMILTGFIFGELSQYYGMVFYSFNRPYNRIESAFYATFNRILFAGWGALLTILCVNRKLGWFGRFIRLKLFVLLDRLTYCAFLVNTVVQMYHAASQLTPYSSSGRQNIIWMVTCDVVLSYAVGLLLHVSVEAPIMNLCKLLQSAIVRQAIKKSPNMLKDVEGQIINDEKTNATLDQKMQNDDSKAIEASEENKISISFTNEAYSNDESKL